MIYTIGGIKGGSGKTTIATNLTVWLSSQGRDVLLVDADDQETATDFTVWRSELTGGNTGYTAIRLSDSAVRTEVLKLEPKYDDIVIDTGGRDTASQRAALTIAGVFLLPFIPRSFDIWTLEKVTALIEEIRSINPELKILAFLNRSDPAGVTIWRRVNCLARVVPLLFLTLRWGIGRHSPMLLPWAWGLRRSNREIKRRFGSWMRSFASVSPP